MSNIKKYIPAIAAVLMVVIGLAISNSQTSKPEQYKAGYIDVFDTVTEFLGYDSSEEEFKTKAKLLNDELLVYHQLYDIYNEYDGINNLKTINNNAGIAPVVVDSKIIDLIKFSKDVYEKTDGEINIAMGSVLSIWHNYRSYGKELPPIEDLKEAAKHCDINNIIIDETASTVYLADPEMSLDVGSIGKGYAVQMVAEHARNCGYDNMVINCGGNVAAIGTKPDNTNWKFGIQNPDLKAANNLLKTVSFADRCLVTSGDYQRYYVVDGVEYCHIIDPDTLMPANYFKSVSIITNHSGLADALSTALFNMPYEDGLTLINSIEDAEAIWVFEDGSIHYSDSFEKYISE